jgi:hypothetical protein
MRHVKVMSFNEWVQKKKSSEPVSLKKKKMSAGDGAVATTNRYQNRIEPDFQNFVPAKPLWKC